MKILDQILLNKYLNNDTSYQLARYISIILIFLFILFFFLFFIDYETISMQILIPIVLSITVISLTLIKLGYLSITVPFFLITINIISTVIVFSLNYFTLYEVYMISTFQLIILFISTLITNNKFYAFSMSIIGVFTLIIHLFFRGLVLAKEIVYSNFEDYIVSAALIALSGYLLSRIIVQKQKMTEKIKEDLKKSEESNKKLGEAYDKLEELQETMVQAEKMRSIGSLAAGMAHEINNPLAGVVQGAQAVANRLMSDTAANKAAAEKAGVDLKSLRNFMTERKIFSQLEYIKSSGNRASDIVNSILSFARKDGQRSSHNITLLIKKSLLLAEKDYYPVNKCSFKEIEIIEKYENNLPLVPCDSGKIQQALLNIFKNGAEAMCGQITGSATTESPKFTIIITALEGIIRIVIENNGPGIDPKIHKDIFNPFFTTNPEGKGIGLGLAVAYFIITETHSGSLSVLSIKDSGVKFIIELPV